MQMQKQLGLILNVVLIRSEPLEIAGHAARCASEAGRPHFLGHRGNFGDLDRPPFGGVVGGGDLPVEAGLLTQRPGCGECRKPEEAYSRRWPSLIFGPDFFC